MDLTPSDDVIRAVTAAMGFAPSGAQSPGPRVVVAMSGGVDSSVAAAVLVRAGFDVVGLTMQLYDHGAATAKAKACCAGQDIYDARRVADRIGIPHYVVDYEATFKADVIDRFADSYVRGETPVPCILCNQTVKFRDLMKAAKDLGADALATGHYVRRERGAGGPELHRAADATRDQSYFLFATPRETLAYLRFPLGAVDKTMTRALAAELGLHVAAKPDSQDICFVPDGRYAEIVKRLRPEGAVPGAIRHVDGRVLGRHEGVIHFTVGQRKGLGIGGETEPLYVVRLDPECAEVIVGPKTALEESSFSLTGVNWLGEGAGPPADGISLAMKLRNTHVPVAGTVFGEEGAAARVVLDAPEAAVTPGQACVFYDGPRVVGGGWIARARAAPAAHNLRRAQVAARAG